MAGKRHGTVDGQRAVVGACNVPHCLDRQDAAVALRVIPRDGEHAKRIARLDGSPARQVGLNRPCPLQRSSLHADGVIRRKRPQDVRNTSRLRVDSTRDREGHAGIDRHGSGIREGGSVCQRSGLHGESSRVSQGQARSWNDPLPLDALTSPWFTKVCGDDPDVVIEVPSSSTTPPVWLVKLPPA